MNLTDEELLQHFQRGVKRIMRFYNDEPEDQDYAYQIYDKIFKMSSSMFLFEWREALEEEIAVKKLAPTSKQELLNASSKGDENERVFTFFDRNILQKVDSALELSVDEMRKLDRRASETKGWWLVKSEGSHTLYLLYIFPYLAYDFPERLKDTELWSDYDGLSFYYASIYPTQRNSVSFSKEKGDKPFPWTSGKGWEGSRTKFVYLGRTVKEIIQPQTQGILNWWGFLAD